MAKHPNNMNPRLPFALQRQLNEMSPREYLCYIFEEMTLEERESLMMDEHQRRKTFLGNWPYSKTSMLSGIKMAQSGLYSLNNSDQV